MTGATRSRRSRFDASLPERSEEGLIQVSSPAAWRAEFEQTAMPLLPALLRAAKRLSPERESADDLVQETYLRAYRTFGGFETGTNCRAWLFTILRSVILNRKRSSVRRPAPDSLDQRMEADGGEEPAAMANDRTDSVATQRSRECIREAFRALPTNMRWILLLVDVEDFSYADVARILDCPVGTVSSRVYRARQQMETLLPAEVTPR